MVADPQRQWMSVEEYLELDRSASDVRYEYFDGYVRAMSGGSMGHAWIAINMILLLNEQLQSGPCRVANSDVRVQVSKSRYVYPDVTVSCDVSDNREDNDIVRSAHLVVEVLSPTTELDDRGKKLTYYQGWPSVQEYVLIGSQRQSVEIYRRQGVTWTHHRYMPGQTVVLESLDIQIPFADIYARVRVPIED
jgi:Uma2 family endonuclease